MQNHLQLRPNFFRPPERKESVAADAEDIANLQLEVEGRAS
jgi:hypothetical protein